MSTVNNLALKLNCTEPPTKQTNDEHTWMVLERYMEKQMPQQYDHFSELAVDPNDIGRTLRLCSKMYILDIAVWCNVLTYLISKDRIPDSESKVLKNADREMDLFRMELSTSDSPGNVVNLLTFDVWNVHSSSAIRVRLDPADLQVPNPDDIVVPHSYVKVMIEQLVNKPVVVVLDSGRREGFTNFMLLDGIARAYKALKQEDRDTINLASQKGLILKDVMLPYGLARKVLSRYQFSRVDFNKTFNCITVSLHKFP